jgi:hypothetical protein
LKIKGKNKGTRVHPEPPRVWPPTKRIDRCAFDCDNKRLFKKKKKKLIFIFLCDSPQRHAAAATGASTACIVDRR